MPWPRLRSGFRKLARWFGPIPGAGVKHDPLAVSPAGDETQFLRELADSIDQALLLWDLRAGRVLYASPALRQLTGVAPGDPAGLAARLAGLVHPEDRDRLRAQLVALRDDEKIETEFRIRRPDGAERWLRARVFPVRDPSGAIARRAALVADITTDRQAWEQLRAECATLEARIDQRATEMGRALDEARRNEARFNEAQHIGRIGSWELDLVTSKLLWSDEIFRIFEIDPYGFGASYEAFLETIHPDDREAVNKAYTESVRNKTPYEIVHRLRMRDGRVKYVRERCETFYADDGRPLRSMGTVQDITAQLQAQQERDRAQALLMTIMDSSPDWIYVKDREHRFLMTNRSCAAVVGRTPEELIGRPDTDFWPRELCEGDPQRGIRGFHEDDRQAFAGKVIHNPEVPALMHEGEARIFDTYKCPLRDSSGEIYGVLGYSRDVTEQRRAERTLRNSAVTLEQHVTARTTELEAARHFTETLLDIVGALVVVLDRDGRIVRFNRACETVTGYAAAEALGRCVWDFLLLPEEREPVKSVFQTLRAGQFPEKYENAWLTRAGESRHIAWSNTVMTDAAGNVEYVVGTGVDITEQKIAEAALRTNEELFRQVAENMQEIMFVRDVATNRMVYVSPAYETIWGRRCHALYNDPDDFLQAVHPEDRPIVEFDRRHNSGNGSFNREFRMLHPDGSVRWVWVRTFPIRDADGRVYRVAGLVQDFTERKAAEEALRVNEQILRQMSENIDEVLFVRDIVQDRVVYVSPGYDKIFGRPRIALIENPRDFMDTVHPEDLPAVQQAMTRQRAGQGWFNLEYRLQRPDGEIRWVWAQTFPIRDANGQVDRVAGVIRDLTERKRAEQALAESEAQFREVADNITEVFWLVSPDRRTMHYVSPAFEQVWGRPRSDLYANPKVVFDMIHPEDRDRIMAETLPQMRASEFRDSYDQEYRIIRPDGEVRWLHVRYHPIHDAGGAVYRIAGVGEDITERKESEEQRLAHAREQRDTLVREVHHRIKNNLQGVVGLLRQHAGEHPQTALPLEMAIARIRSMALVFGLRSHASTERVLLCQMTEAICRSIADLTGATIEPRVERRGPCPVPVTEGEAVPLALILNELVFNAVKHQTRGVGRPRVTIDIDYTDQHAMVTIVTPAAHLPHGFDFAAGRGLGSGLQLVRSLLPRPAADLELRDSDAGVVAELTLRSPVIMELADAMALLTDEHRAVDVRG